MLRGREAATGMQLGISVCVPLPACRLTLSMEALAIISEKQRKKGCRGPRLERAFRIPCKPVWFRSGTSCTSVDNRIRMSELKLATANVNMSPIGIHVSSLCMRVSESTQQD